MAEAALNSPSVLMALDAKVPASATWLVSARMHQEIATLLPAQVDHQL